MEGTGEGCGFFYSPKLPYLSTLSQQFCRRLQYPAILIEQARLIKDLSYSKKISGICLFSFRRALPAYLDDDLERLQRRALRIIYPTLSYAEALSASRLPTLFKRREQISSKLFVEISTNEGHKLHSLLPEVNMSTNSLRKQRPYKLPRCRTERCKNRFILSHVKKNIKIYMKIKYYNKILLLIMI